jgi:hypothetical protein
MRTQNGRHAHQGLGKSHVYSLQTLSVRIVTMKLGVAASRESAAGNGFEDWRRSAETPLRNVGSWKARNTGSFRGALVQWGSLQREPSWSTNTRFKVIVVLIDYSITLFISIGFRV